MVDRTDSSTDNIITTTEPSPMGQSSKPENRRWRWTAADIAVGAALGVACGLVFWGFNFAYAWLSPLIGGILPGLASVLHPLWYFSGTLAVIILRKPGAAIYVNLVGSAAEMLLGNQFSFGFVFASAALQGVFSELPFALTRYKVFNLPISMASGALVALEYGVYLMLFRYQGVSFLSPRGVIHMVQRTGRRCADRRRDELVPVPCDRRHGRARPLRLGACAVRRVTSGCLL